MPPLFGEPMARLAGRDLIDTTAQAGHAPQGYGRARSPRLSGCAGFAISSRDRDMREARDFIGEGQGRYMQLLWVLSRAFARRRGMEHEPDPAHDAVWNAALSRLFASRNGSL